MAHALAVSCSLLVAAGLADAVAAQEPVATPAPTGSGIRIEPFELGKRVLLDGEPFTEHRHAGHLTPMPILYPLLGPGGVPMTRNHPMVVGVAGEEDDHPHQRSVWFAHGELNGRDFWAGTQSKDVIVHQRYVDGAGPTTIHSQNAWVDRAGVTLCTDDRVLGFGAYDDGARWIDLDITIHASHGALHFGDTKEGLMAVRVHPALRLRGPLAKGSIVNSEGVAGDEAWGKRARWVAYHGPVDGEHVGLALLDHAQNLRHPCWWHARDYGLLAANPFGAHAFARAGEKAGDWDLEAGGDLRLRYRIVMFRGTPESARLTERWADFVRPASETDTPPADSAGGSKRDR